MAANLTPIFPKAGQTSTCAIEAANTARDGSGSLVDLITGATDGTIVYQISAYSAQASLATFATKVVNVFKTNSGGTSPRLIKSIVMTGATPSNTTASVEYTAYFSNGLRLISGEKLQVCQTVYASAVDKTDVIAYADSY